MTGPCVAARGSRRRGRSAADDAAIKRSRQLERLSPTDVDDHQIISECLLLTESIADILYTAEMDRITGSYHRGNRNIVSVFHLRLNWTAAQCF
jgi:hypothetical protein